MIFVSNLLRVLGEELMVSPNTEQLKAIEHEGGVLLSAGAGSGKTFVLENHINYLCQKWIDEHLSGPQAIDLGASLRQKFKSVALMTFTRKAAGELELRIQKSFELKAKTSENWQVALKELPSLTVGTIHSFCLKLISQGFFSGLPRGQRMLSESEFQANVEDLLEEWMIENKDNDLTELFHRQQKSLVKSIQNILMDPSLRVSWDEASLEELSDKRLNEIIEELYLEYGLNSCREKFPIDSYSEYEKKPWFLTIKDFCSENSEFTSNKEGFLKAMNFFEQRDFKIPRTPTGKTLPPEIPVYWGKIKALKDFCKDFGTDIEAFINLKDSHVTPWFSQIKSMVKFIEAKYQADEGLTFSDLEFYVYKGLRNSKTAQKIQEQYKYFIVDEFQDTSFIQFEILRRLAGEDFNRLFCVGDVKQAIYGFRGGELAVFMECSQRMRERLSLKNNYRSASKVIEFNNQFFENLFQKGRGFEGEERHLIPYESQDVPESTTLKGAIRKVILPIAPDDSKVSNFEINYLEAKALLEQIKVLPRTSDIAILYRKLAPSRQLIKFLIESNIGFSAQTKVPFGQDPVIGLFMTFIQRELNSDERNKDESALFMLRQYVALIGGDPSLPTTDLLHLFDRRLKFYGLGQAFEMLLEELGLSNANFKINLAYIQDIINIELDIERIYLRLKREAGEANSVEFKFGDNPDRIKIMTAHASKGLEFDHVFLGGIYTNDSSFPDTSLIGKIPSSFKWSETIFGKKKFKTPHLMLEEIQTKAKEFSENKRLFYVANTRAVETLTWIELDFSERKREREQSSHWFKGIEAVLSDIELDVEKIESSVKTISPNLDELKNSPPLFHLSKGGLLVKKEQSSSMLLPELSVTRLSQVEQCPRKFYLSNICKLSNEDIELAFKDPIEYSNESLTPVSSALRGTKIHELISQLIKSDFLPEDIDLNESDIQKAEWAVEKLRSLGDNFEFYSEKQIKFEIFQYMISGIPDLFAINKESQAGEIWDFKTGRLSEEKLPPYWFQLYAYASALFSMGLVSKDKPIKLVLCFVDEERNLELSVSLEDVENYMEKVFLKTQTPWNIDLDHCQFCDFQKICKQ